MFFYTYLFLKSVFHHPIVGPIHLLLLFTVFTYYYDYYYEYYYYFQQNAFILQPS